MCHAVLMEFCLPSGSTGVLLVAYGGFRPALEFLNGLARASRGECPFVLVLNGTLPDGYRSEIRADLVHIVETHSNYGYLGGVHRGLDYSRSRGLDPEFWFIANADVRFSLRSVFKLTSDLDASIPHLIGPRVRERDGSNRNPFRVLPPTRKHLLLRRLGLLTNLGYVMMSAEADRRRRRPRRELGPTPPAFETRRKVYAVHGSGFMATRSLLQSVAWSEAPFLYGEELFLAQEVTRCEGKTMYDPRVEVFHEGQVSTGSLTMTDKRKLQLQALNLYSRRRRAERK